jgi:nicotinate-nucleotide adenylyltransferase
VKKQIGIYSGTFDPIHSGHLAFALQALKECGLEQIVFLPESNPRKKNKVTDIIHRTELIKRSIVGVPKLSVVNTTSQQFTVKQTLPELTALFPDARFTFLFGSDVIKNLLYGWSDLNMLLSGSSLAVGMRANDNTDEIVAVLEELKKRYNIPIDYRLVYTPNTAVTSSHIRQGLKDIANLHSDVNEYIKNNKLYK